jgi:hypothetical protein
MNRFNQSRILLICLNNLSLATKLGGPVLATARSASGRDLFATVRIFSAGSAFLSKNTLSMQVDQAVPDFEGRPHSSFSVQISVDRRLLARDQVSQSLLGQPSRKQLRNYFLHVHESIITYVFA